MTAVMGIENCGLFLEDKGEPPLLCVVDKLSPCELLQRPHYYRNPQTPPKTTEVRLLHN